MTDAAALRRALAALWALSLATTWLALLDDAGFGPALATAATAPALLLAALKADLILTRYLGLAEAPVWRRGFRLGLAVLTSGLFALQLAPLLGGAG